MQTAAPVSPRSRFEFSTPLFASSILSMCLAEAFTIHGLWFGSHDSSRRLHSFDLVPLLCVPAILGYSILHGTKRCLRAGQMSYAFASRLCDSVSLLLLVTYLLMTRLAQIAFR